MASPQAENGHLDVAHEIAEALCRINLSAYESRIVWFVLRKTYGWHKKVDRISLSQFSEGTQIEHSNMIRSLKHLIKRKIITRTPEMEYGLQKDFEQWEGVVSKETPPVSKETLAGDQNTHPAGKKKQKPRPKQQTLEEYQAELSKRFPQLNFGVEMEKYNLWHEKNPAKRPKLALLNWMTKAQEFKDKGGSNGYGKAAGSPGQGTDRNRHKDWPASIDPGADDDIPGGP